MVKEIGSEFHKMSLENGEGIEFPRPGSLVFSGRTAIEAALSLIPEARTALLPSYCCDSMIAPFRNAGIFIKFYDVNWDKGIKIKINDNADILLWCNFFGYRDEMPEFDGTIIEDITHSLFSEKQCHERSNYLIASVRKWEPVNCGGYISTKVEYPTPPDIFVRQKTTAMSLKSKYLENIGKGKKEQYLSLFEENNHWLTENYSKLSIDPWSRKFLSHVEMDEQKRIRRENARTLYEGLIGKVEFLFPVEEMDCPLFVPIVLENRNEIRMHLIKEEIYCPIHWPRPEKCVSNLYDKELSLICDQRYGIEDMQRIITVLSEVL